MIAQERVGGRTLSVALPGDSESWVNLGSPLLEFEGLSVLGDLALLSGLRRASFNESLDSAAVLDAAGAPFETGANDLALWQLFLGKVQAIRDERSRAIEEEESDDEGASDGEADGPAVAPAADENGTISLPPPSAPPAAAPAPMSLQDAFDAFLASRLIAPSALSLLAARLRHLEMSLGAAAGALSVDYAPIGEPDPEPGELAVTGLDAMLGRLAASLPALWLDSPVVSIQHGDLWARALLADGRAPTAQYVLCTVPLAVLKQGGLSLAPPPPAPFVDALAGLGTGSATVVAMLFDSVRWR